MRWPDRDGRRERDVVAAALTGLLAVLAAVLVLACWAWWVGGPLGAAAWFACAAAVAVVVPLTRGWAERGAERLVFGADGDPYAVLARFVDDISGAIAVDDVLPQLARAAATATHSPTGQATVRLPDGDAYRQTWPPEVTSIHQEVTVPLQHAGRLVGELGVQAADEVADADRARLQRFSGPAGLALANVGLTFELRRQLAQEEALLGELQASRQRLLTAAAEQRVRFSADVAEVVVPQIAAAQQALVAVADGDAGAIATARAGTQQALESLRGLASRVYQVTLAERGLVAAVERLMEGRPQLRWSGGAPPEVPRLPAEVEEAAYFALLALVDPVAGSSAADLDVALVDGGGLVVTVTGPSAPPPQSVQLARDRADAAGGRVSGGEGPRLELELCLPAPGLEGRP